MGDRQVVFLHGIGTGPESWDAQVTGLATGISGHAPRIAGLDAPGFSLQVAAQALVDDLDRRGMERAHLCGLSLGAMVATQVAISHPDRVASLILSGGQVRPPRVLMAFQLGLMRLLPSSLVARDGTDKAHMLDAFRAVSGVDFRPHLASIAAPTLVLCGARDFPNIPGAKALEAGIPRSFLVVIKGGGHEMNTQMPEVFTSAVNQFLIEITAQESPAAGEA